MEYLQLALAHLPILSNLRTRKSENEGAESFYRAQLTPARQRSVLGPTLDQAKLQEDRISEGIEVAPESPSPKLLLKVFF